MKRALICFTRIPTAAAEGDRLAPALTARQSAMLQRAFLKDLSRVAAAVDAALYIAYAPGPGAERLRTVFPGAAGYFPQQGEELGGRMAHALDTVLAMGYDACVLFGGDVPLMTADHLESAFHALEEADVTLGPAEDGGYYLVGLKAPCPELFRQQSYGTSAVCRNAIAAAMRAGRSVAVARRCRDVDSAADLPLLWTFLRGSRCATANYLRSVLRGREAPLS